MTQPRRFRKIVSTCVNERLNESSNRVMLGTNGFGIGPSWMTSYTHTPKPMPFVGQNNDARAHFFSRVSLPTCRVLSSILPSREGNQRHCLVWPHLTSSCSNWTLIQQTIFASSGIKPAFEPTVGCIERARRKARRSYVLVVVV